MAPPRRASAGFGVQIEGLEEYRRELRRAGRELDDLREVYDKIATLVRSRAAGAAPSGLAGAIRKRVSREGAEVEIYHNPQRALGVFMGAKRRFGWYAAPRYRASAARQFEPWVGNQWEPGLAEGKPYFIGDAINDAVPDVEDLFGDEVERLLGRAYPEGGGGMLGGHL